jgi:hypothetical protein
MGRAAGDGAAGGQYGTEEDEARAERAREFAVRTTEDLEAELYGRQGELERMEKDYPEFRVIPVLERRIQVLNDEIERRRADDGHG